VIAVVAVTLTAAGAGIVALRRWGPRATRAAELGLSANLWLILPIVTFFNAARFKYSAEVGVGIVFAYGGLAMSLALAYVLARRLGLEDHTRGAFLCASFVTNTGFLGLPFTAALLGYDDLPEAIAYDLAVSAPSLLVVAFAIGAYYRHEHHVAERGVRAFLTRNPALYAALAGLVVPDSLAPDVAVDASRALVVLMAPIGFFALGVFASQGDGERFRFPPRLTTPVLVVSILKLCVPVSVVAICAELVHPVPDAYLVQAAMPTGLNTLLLVSAYRLDREITAGAIVYTTAVVLVWGLIAAAVI
jgi:malate permease and related proteins